MSAALPPPVDPIQAEATEILDELARAYEEIHLLHGLAASLEDGIEHKQTFSRIVESLKELLPVLKAELWVPSAQPTEYRCTLCWEAGTVSNKLLLVETQAGIDEQLRSAGVKVLRGRAEPESPLDRFLAEITFSSGRPAVVAPLFSRSKLLGLLVLKLPETHESLDSSRLRLVEAAARQTSISMQIDFLVRELRANERLKKEIEIARQIQHGLLPEKIPQHADYDLFGGCVTAARVGGDYYDLYHNPGAELGLLIADVAGHSIGSALIAMSFRTTFRLYLDTMGSPGTLFERINDSLHQELSKSGSFLSTFFGTFNPGTRSFQYVNAGHNPPVLWVAREQRFLRLEEAGLLMGILPGQTYEHATLGLGSGDVLVLYTDGIVEAENQRGEFFGLERLEDAIRKNLQRSAREMYHYLLKQMYMFQDEQFNKDDVTLIILKVH